MKANLHLAPQYHISRDQLPNIAMEKQRTVPATTLRVKPYSGYIAGGVLLSILVWGSALLFATVAHLRELTLELKYAQPPDLFVRKDHTEANTTGRIGFAEIRNSSFKPNYKSVQWMSEPDSFEDDKGTYATDDNGVYLLKSLQDDTYEKLLYNGSFVCSGGVEYTISDFVASPNLQKALIQTNWTHNWRHSSFALYWILDIDTQEISPLHQDKLAVAHWSPTSDHIAYVLENDLYVLDLEKNTTVRASNDGSEHIFNGRFDWVYEEEVFGDDTALWWSPHGDFLAFFRTNDTLVPDFPITYFVQDNSSYPELRNIKYSNPGYDIPDVQLAIYNLTSEKAGYVDYSYDIFSEVVWVGDSQLLLKSISREADYLKVVIVDAKDLSFEVVRDEKSDSWFEIDQDTLFVPKSDTREFDGYLDTISVNGFNHLVYFSPPSNSTPKVLTQGDWEVDSAPSGFDYAKDLVYYVSTEVSSIQRHLYSVNLHTAEIEALTKGEGYYATSFSSGSRYVFLSYLGPDIPHQEMIDLYTGESKTLENNTDLAALLEDIQIPKKLYGEADIGTATVNYMEILPPDFDAKKRYPLMFYVYGGPGSQLVTESFGLGFNEVVSAQLDAVVVVVDGRGTGFKGRQFRAVVRDSLGYYEVIDQIAAAKYWAKKDYIDGSRIAMFGWSYGGYMTLKTLEADAGETFSYGLSVAPVTDWALYDAVYTERYMHTPQHNPDGYAKSAVHNVTQVGKAKRFLLCHGTGDDNVHFQNSAKFLDKLDLAGVENYDLRVFPDSDHAIRFHNASTILYDKLFTWLDRAFKGQYL